MPNLGPRTLVAGKPLCPVIENKVHGRGAVSLSMTAGPNPRLIKLAHRVGHGFSCLPLFADWGCPKDSSMADRL